MLRVESSVLVQYIAFVTCGLIASLAQARFFKSVLRHEAGVIAPDDEVFNEIGRSPMRLVPIVARETRKRLGALARRWPDPEVERSRRWAVLWIVVTLGVFGWLAIRPGG